MAFADVAGWSRLIERNDVATLRAWKALRAEVIEPQIQKHTGRLLEVQGDAVVVDFPSAVAAVSWALEVQAAIFDQAQRGDRAGALTVRIGINTEDVIVDEGKLIGNGVNVAARIHQLAAPGEIVVTEAVRGYVRNKLSVAFSDLGERKLKNISRSVRLYRVEGDGLPLHEPIRAIEGQASVRALVAIGAPDAERRVIEQIAAQVLPQRGGRIIGRRPDFLLADFPRAQLAVAAAFAMQQACSKAKALPRIGVQVSGLISGGNSAYARGENLATRLTTIAEPGEIVVSAAVRDELTPMLDADIEDLGDCYLKQMQRPVRAYRLGPPGPQSITGAGVTTRDLKPTIAVIPFTARSGPEVLGEVLADEAISALSRSSELNVISRLSTTAFRGRDADVAQVGAHLHANYVLSGAYRASRGRVVLTAELAEAKSGRVMWAKDLKGRIAGIVDGDDELIDQLVAEVSAAALARELERSQSQSLRTLESYTLLMGAIALMHRLSLQDFDRGREMLQALVGRAPRLAIPQAWLAKWHVLRVWQGWSSDPGADAQSALECTKRALDNDSQCSLALAVDGFVHTNLLKKLEVALERYELALDVNPNDSLAWLLKGTLHAFKGEGKQAMRDSQRALRLSPLDPHRYFYDSLAASAALSAGQYDRAIELAQRSLRANRTHTSTHRVLVISRWQAGRHDDARKSAKELMRLEPTLSVSRWLARSPSGEYEVGRMCARALKEAGVPQ